MPKATVPEHLKSLAATAELLADDLFITLRCPCGGTHFHAFASQYSPEEERQIRLHEEAFDEALKGYRMRLRHDEQGREVLQRKRGLFGRWENVVVPPCPPCADVYVVRGSCAACGQEHLLVDSRLHGADAAWSYPRESYAWQPSHWKRLTDEPDGNVLRAIVNLDLSGQAEGFLSIRFYADDRPVFNSLDQ